MYTPKIRNFLRQADRVAESGKRAAAVELYQQVLDEDNTIIEAWLGIGENAIEESTQREAFEKILTLDPENKEAANHIAALNGDPIPYPNLPKKEAVPAPAPSKPIEKPFKLSVSVPAPVQSRVDSNGKVEPNVGGDFPHPVDISEFVLPDGSMVSYRDRIPTTLRCNRCGRPISSKDSKKTSVGYRCLICIAEIEESYFEATTVDYIIAIVVATILAILAGVLVGIFRNFGIFFYFIIFAVGGAIGTGIARLTHRAIGRRRGRYIPYVVSGIVAAGGILPALLTALISFSIFGLIGPIIYAIAATSAAYYFLK